jgi:DNA sulfur modification protein DndC
MICQKNPATIALIRQEYLSSSDPWFMGYSGGKDSSALLKLLFLALQGLPRTSKPVTVIYCDTGVEIPFVRSHVVNTLAGVEREATANHVPLSVEVASPHVSDRYFVKVIGRGYPPPSNKFRWCTDRLRVKPVAQVLSRAGQASTVLLGVRYGESVERDRTIKRHRTQRPYYFQQSGNRRVRIFAPLVDYSVRDVWSTLGSAQGPTSIAGGRLALLYWLASGECPIMRDPKGTPCGKGRFGCWTCTVVRKDRAVENLVRAGYDGLKPLLTFRDWLADVRDNPAFRCKRRRNGKPGPGPFTLQARKQILQRLLAAQREAGRELVTSDELRAIHELWRQDQQSSSYREA